MLEAIMTNTTFQIDYGRDLEEELTFLCDKIAQFPQIEAMFPARWLAIKLLEQDQVLQTQCLSIPGGPAILTHAQLSHARLSSIYGDDADIIIADRRYQWIHQTVQQVVQTEPGRRLITSDKIDRILTHSWLGIPIFLVIMWVVFKLTADISAPYVDWVDAVINGPLAQWGVAILGVIGLGGTWLESLFVDGIIAGVGGVLVFVPVLLSLYFALAVLEDSGYMARAAFVMDRLMAKIGLHGKSFLPMLVGFGCSVPAIYATRTLENEKDRILTGLLVPFMSCSARLPVYILFAAIFFPQHGGVVVFSLYLLGIMTALFLGIILKRTIFQNEEQSVLVMELPPYRIPALHSIWFHMWTRTKSFIKHAWTIILLTSILIWFLRAMPVKGEGTFADTPIENSAFATASEMVSPILAPLGFGNWQAGGALLTGFVAKEVVVSTLAQTYGTEIEESMAAATFSEEVTGILVTFLEAARDTIKSIPLIVGIDLFAAEEEAEPTALMTAIRADFDHASGGYGTLAALAFMVFVLIYTPCMVAVSAEKQELGAKWMWVSIVGQFMLAWLLAFAVFQIGKLIF